MNDPGHDEEIVQADSQAENANHTKSRQGGGQGHPAQPGAPVDTTHIKSWYASTGFPLIAASIAPMASTFSLCAVVENWRVEIPPGGTEGHGIDLEDPTVLIAVNAVSLVLALIANVSLLLNMTKRLRFQIAQSITILGFWIASMLLIALLIFASTKSFHAPNVQNQALTQAYYYALFAAIIYQITSYMMCYTAWSAYRGDHGKGFDLTTAQRTLMLQTISFLAYLLIGALIFSKVEKWAYLDAVYWSSFTLLTVGIGDYAPSTHIGRSLLFPYAVGGIITVGLVVSSIRSLALDRGAEQITQRMVERTRERVVKQINSSSRKGLGFLGSRRALKKDAVGDLAQEPNDGKMDELRRRKAEFEAMRVVQEVAARRKRWSALLMSSTSFAVLWFVGAAVFWQAERNQQWSYFQALYFSYTSVLTIGYGDLYPMSNSGKPFFVLWSLLAVPTLTILISNMGDTVVKGVKEATIWLGEISFLPSSEGHVLDKLKHAFHQGTFGHFKPAIAKSKSNTEEDTDEDAGEWAAFSETHLGLVQLFDVSDRKEVQPNDWMILHIWDTASKEEGDLSNASSGNISMRRIHAEHNYQHLLTTHIVKLYADTKQVEPKKYSYFEWTFYLKLLGENEADSSHHRRALPKQKTHNNDDRGSSSSGSEENRSRNAKPEGQNNNSGTPGWSWIGERSPLMQGQNEAEFLLERLMQRLEESLRSQKTRYQHHRLGQDHTEGAWPTD